jgi:hypothetical protein
LRERSSREAREGEGLTVNKVTLFLLARGTLTIDASHLDLSRKRERFVYVWHECIELTVVRSFLRQQRDTTLLFVDMPMSADV